MPDTRAVLVAARALIERGWTQRAAARNEAGLPVSYRSETATCWCLSGALRVSSNGSDQRWLDVLAFMRTMTPRHSVVAFNDDPDTSQSDVLALFDRAIERAGSGA